MKEKPEETPLRVFSGELERLSQDARHWAEDSNGRAMRGPYHLDVAAITGSLKPFFGNQILEYEFSACLEELEEELEVRRHHPSIFNLHAHSLVVFGES